MTDPAQCHCGSISWERRIEESRYICASCKRPLWQPIETAPKNGTTILVYGSWYPDGEWKDLAFATWLAGEEMWTFDGDLMLGMTHWMPLPEPPRE